MAGQSEDQICQLCGAEKEESARFWQCTALKGARTDADQFLAEVDLRTIPITVRHRIAPAMNADPRTPSLGAAGHGDMKNEEDMIANSTPHWRHFFGCENLCNAKTVVKELVEQAD